MPPYQRFVKNQPANGARNRNRGRTPGIAGRGLRFDRTAAMHAPVKSVPVGAGLERNRFTAQPSTDPLLAR